MVFAIEAGPLVFKGEIKQGPDTPDAGGSHQLFERAKVQAVSPAYILQSSQQAAAQRPFFLRSISQAVEAELQGDNIGFEAVESLHKLYQSLGVAMDSAKQGQSVHR